MTTVIWYVCDCTTKLEKQHELLAVGLEKHIPPTGRYCSEMTRHCFIPRSKEVSIDREGCWRLSEKVCRSVQWGMQHWLCCRIVRELHKSCSRITLIDDGKTDSDLSPCCVHFFSTKKIPDPQLIILCVGSFEYDHSFPELLPSKISKVSCATGYREQVSGLSPIIPAKLL